MTKRLFLTLCSLLMISSLSAKDEVVDLAAKELRALFESAEAAMQAHEWGRARDSFRTLIRQGVKQAVNDDTYSDIILRLASAEERLGNLEECIALLETILQKELPESLYRPAMFTLARALLRQGEPLDAQQVVVEIEKWIAQEDWSREERAFALGLRMSIHQHYVTVVEQAGRHLEAGSFSDAAALYQQAIDAIQIGHFEIGEQEADFPKKLRLHLAECYYQLGHYSLVVELLTQGPEEEHQALYLLGLAYRKLGDNERASTLFDRCLAASPDNWEEIAWEHGVAQFEQGAFEEAQRCFQRVAREGREAHLTHLAQIYCARIQLERGEYEELPTTLHMLSALVPADDPLQYEIAYLRGEGAYHTRDYLSAARLFEESLPLRNQEKAEWYAAALYNAGWSYLMLGSDEEREGASRAAFLYKAEQLFKRVLSYNRDERACLALGRTYIAQGEALCDLKAMQKAESLLSQPHLFSTLEVQAEALLLRAQATKAFALRERLYCELTDPVYQEAPCYAEGWYCRGLNLFEQGECLRKRGDHEIAIPLYESAARSLLQAFELLKGSNPADAASALGYAAQSYYNQGSLESRKLASGLLDTLFEDEESLLAHMRHPEEALYLRGLISASLLSETGEEHYLESAALSLGRLVEEFGTSHYASSALHILGTTQFHLGEYEKAEELFAELAALYPDSRYAGDAWFWAGESAERQHKGSEQVRSYRQQVYSRYPNSYFAAEAYFNTYSFTEYLRGTPEAIDHLSRMKERYPDSPYLIVACYLTGLDHKQGQRSIAALRLFEEATELFRQCQAEGLITLENVEYFATIYYKSRLESALTQLALAQEFQEAKREETLAAAEKSFSEIARELGSENHQLARLLEEAEFGLAQVRLHRRDDIAAEAILRKMLAHYEECQVSCGYYPSCVHYELGLIAMRRGEYTIALEELEQAEQCAANGALSREQQLSLWLQKALCHRARGELEQSMLMLSLVINDESTSLLRFEAMFLRAEVYELQGRHELAIKQLEATARKGGQWATKANEKLRREYGFN